MSRVIEAATGAQILPRVADERANITSWSAYVAANADGRTKYQTSRDIAGRLIVVPSNTRENV